MLVGCRLVIIDESFLFHSVAIGGAPGGGDASGTVRNDTSHNVVLFRIGGNLGFQWFDHLTIYGKRRAGVC
ncbi:MAG: hypothetical protein KatS3mg110_0680 [Pirellulaceae bacterium]|nr:MAG: hypothetical protein KatS3mg110_0680 [Pirellulaceae bacterium]